MSSLLREAIPLALAAGAVIGLIAVSTIGVLVGDTGFSTNDTLEAAIKIGFGVLLVAVGLRALVRPPKPKAPKSDAKPPSIGGSFLAGAGGMASNLTTLRQRRGKGEVGWQEAAYPVHPIWPICLLIRSQLV